MHIQRYRSSSQPKATFKENKTERNQRKKKEKPKKREIMKLSQLILAPLVSARFDLGAIAEEPVENGLQCPPKDRLIILIF